MTMRKFALPLVILAGLAAATGAQAAAPSTVEGLIKSLNVKADTLTLKSGSVFKLAKGLKIASYKAGEKVKITWTKVGKVYEATAVVVE
jgi:hypothetical protein